MCVYLNKQEDSRQAELPIRCIHATKIEENATRQMASNQRTSYLSIYPDSEAVSHMKPLINGQRSRTNHNEKT